MEKQRWILTEKTERIKEQQVPFPFQITVCGKGNGIVPLAEFFTVGIGNKGKVKIVRLRITEESLQMNLPGRGRKKVDSSHYLVHARFRIIHHHGQLVGEWTVRPFDHKIAARGSNILADRPHQSVHEADRFVSHPHPERTRAFSRGQTFPAEARIDRTLVTRMGRRCYTGDFGAGAAARIGDTTLQEPVECRGIGLTAATLPKNFAVPLKTEGLKGPKHIFGNSGNHPRRVEIFYAQKPSPSALPGQQVTAKGRYQGTEMQGSGGRRGKAADC